MKAKSEKFVFNWILASLVMSVLLALALSAANVIFGPLNLDEGWYLLAAKSFASGARPYRDFFFTQAPLMPATYGLLSPLWSSGGVLGGRILTALLGLGASALAALAASRSVGKRRSLVAGLTVFMLLQCNVVHSYFTAIPKTYALAAAFVSGGALFLAMGLSGAHPSYKPAFFAAGILFAAASGTRLSLGAMLPATGLCLLAFHRRRPYAWLAFGIGASLGLLCIFIPALHRCRDQFIFANFFHGGRGAGGFAMQAGSIARILRNYMPIALLAIAPAAIAILGNGKACSGNEGGKSQQRLSPQTLMAICCAAAFALPFAVHLLAPFPYDDYQTPAMPLAAIAVSVTFWEKLPKYKYRRDGRIMGLFFIAILLFAMTSPFCESWAILRKDRFWVESKTKPDLIVLRETGRRLKGMVPEGAPILTQDTYLAVEADRPVPKGFEMGPFGFFADLSDEEAQRYHVLNRNLARKTIATCNAPVAAFSGYAFAMSAPGLARDNALHDEMLDFAAQYYEPVCAVLDFGQEHTHLDIALRWPLETADIVEEQTRHTEASSNQ